MTGKNQNPQPLNRRAAALGPRLAPGRGELKASTQNGHLYKRILNSGTFDGRKIAVLRSHTAHKTVPAKRAQ